MKCSKHWWWAVLVLVFCLGTQVVLARSHSFERLHIEAWLGEDGSLKVEEQRTVRFDGEFTGMFQWIDTSRGITVKDIQIREDDRLYERNPKAEIGPAGTFFVREDPRSVYVDWSYLARDETRTFIVSYVLENAVNLHEDVGELYIKFVGDHWDQQTKQVEVLLHLPPGASKQDVRAWGHGPLNGLVEILDGQQVRWTVKPLPTKTILEGRVTFPTYLLQASAPYAVITHRQALDDILAEEQVWAKEANQERFLQRVKWVLAVLIVIGSLVMAIRAYLLWGREYRPQFDGDYYRELPKDYSPAEMSVLYYNGTISTKDLTATVLDLARRKWIKIEEITPEKKGILRRRKDTDYMMTKLEGDGKPLAPHETRVMDLLFDTVASEERGSVSFKDLEDFAKKQRTTFASFWEQWQNSVKSRAKRHGFFDTTNAGPRKKVFLLGMLLLVLAIPAFIVKWLATGFACLIGGFIAILGGASVHRRSLEGAEDFAKWRAFRKFLLHFSEMQRQEIPSLVIWEHYLVYAVSLGVAKEVIKQLQVVYPGLEDDGYRFGYGWYYIGTRGIGNFERSLSQLTSSMQKSFQQSIAAATGQSSSGSGAGGGFSGGGGGGVGGGGGGVR
ncbi:MAG: DUF2207 domain-containing protein [Limnochordia bacterium]|jgi:uncharacterized membrane protein